MAKDEGRRNGASAIRAGKELGSFCRRRARTKSVARLVFEKHTCRVYRKRIARRTSSLYRAGKNDKSTMPFCDKDCVTPGKRLSSAIDAKDDEQTGSGVVRASKELGSFCRR